MDNVKWGVIGAGGIADRRTIPGIMAACNAELVSVMDVNMQLAEKIRDKYKAKNAYSTVEELLSDTEVEAVYIASPVVYHKDQVLKAALAGKHILVEKTNRTYRCRRGRNYQSMSKNRYIRSSGIDDEISLLSSKDERAD